MKTVIIYASVHHNNTKELVCAIAAENDIDVVDAAKINEKASEYAALQSSVEQAAARGYVDTIINPEDTRKYIIAAFEMLFDKREVRADKKHGTV